ncbi:MAG: hypothetical protein AB7S41_08030 [Parvibaculaceae bacterium]
MSGWLIRASLPAPAGSSGWAANFRVGLEDADAAREAVRAHLGRPELDIVAVGQLSDEMTRALAIGAGEVRPTHAR